MPKWMMIAIGVYMVVQMAVTWTVIIRRRPMFAVKEAALLRAFEQGVYTLASRYGFMFEPCGVVPGLLGKGEELTPPRALGRVGHFSVEVSVRHFEEGHGGTCLRFVPHVRLQGWPIAWLGLHLQLRRPPQAGKLALARLRACGYEAYSSRDGLLVARRILAPILSEYRRVETDPARLQQAFDLALELVYSYPPKPG